MITSDKDVFDAPAYAQMVALFPLVPIFGVNAWSFETFWAYSSGYDIETRATNGKHVTNPNTNIDGHIYLKTFTAKNADNVIREGSREYGAARIIDHLDDNNFWKQIKSRWRRNKDRSAIQYLCTYYLNRFRGIRNANPGWVPSKRCEDLVTWMQSIVL